MTEDRFVGMGERGAARPWRVYRGRPLPLGVSQTRLGLNFAVFSRHATAMTLALFAVGWHVLGLAEHPDQLPTFTFQVLLWFGLFTLFSLRERRA